MGKKGALLENIYGQLKQHFDQGKDERYEDIGTKVAPGMEENLNSPDIQKQGMARFMKDH